MANDFSANGTHYENLLPSPDVLRRLAVSESGFVFDPVSGNSFTVNETGLAIIRVLQHDRDLQSITELLQREFDVKLRELERDLLEFAGTLRDCVGSS